MSEQEQVQLDKVRTDGGTQPRAAIDEQVVQGYAERIEAGDAFPPIVVFYDGSDYWLADGFHRVLAYRALGRKRVAAEVHQGHRREAILYSVGANHAHGLPRSNADKRRAVMTLLRDEEWSGWTDREIAKRCLVSQPFVTKLRPPAPVTDNGYQSAPRKYVTKHGTTATMRTDRINADRPKREAPSDPAPESPTDRVPWPEKPDAQVRQERAEIAQRFQLFDALAALATMPVSPSEFIEECPEHSVYRVDEHLDGAVEWLTKFADEWRSR